MESVAADAVPDALTAHLAQQSWCSCEKEDKQSFHKMVLMSRLRAKTDKQTRALPQAEKKGQLICNRKSELCLQKQLCTFIEQQEALC